MRPSVFPSTSELEGPRVIAAAAELRALGRHRIIAKLGQGGMANVYLTVVQGQHGVNKLLVAKVLLEDLAKDPDFRTMFVKEARVATLLSHRNLVQSFEVAETDGHHYITMEYLDGRPLHLVLAAVGREQIPLGVHIEILAQALAGLHSAHEQKDLTGQSLDLVHRDVSPQNVFVTYDGDVKVVDFGVAKVRGAGTVSETGSLVGKIGYIAPEQALSQAVDRRADVFAVGIMLWEALARRSFVERGDGEAATLRKRLNGEIPSPRTAAPDAPEELIAICERAIAYEPDERFATAADFEDALRRYLEKKGSRIGARDIAQTIAPAFAKERTEMQAMLEERLAGSDLRPEDLDGPAPSQAGASRTRPVGRSPLRTWLVLVTAAVAAIVIVGIRVSSAPRTPVTAAPPRPAAPVETPAPTKTVRARLQVTPSSAHLALDGNPLPSNPFDSPLPRDAQTHVLTATAEGYASVRHEIHLDSDVDVDLALIPLPAAPSATPPVAPAPKVARPPGRRIRPVDEKDPYAQ